jgi:hypothetical protein
MTSLWPGEHVLSSAMAEGADPGVFGGLCYADDGSLLRNLHWNDRDSTFDIPELLVSLGHYKPFISQAQQLGIMAASVARIKYGENIASGWVSGGDDTHGRYFISSSHGFKPDFSVRNGYLCFDSYWEGIALFF